MKKIVAVILFFAFVASVSAQLKVNATGNVGIGTATPQYRLDVSGNTRITGGLSLTGSSGILSTTTSNAPIMFKVNGVLAGNTGAYTGSTNVSFGYKALASSGGGGNTAIGIESLYNNTTSMNNTAIGSVVLYNNTTGDSNTAIGSSALQSNTTGNENTAIGYKSLIGNTTGYENTAIGTESLPFNETGSYNTAIGYQSFYDNRVGSCNTVIGTWASLFVDNVDNTTAIGYNAKATSSNQARIGSSGVTSIGGYAGWTNFSDKRAKKNIRANVPGLDFINRLQPVTFNLDLGAIDGLLKIDGTKRPGEKELSPELIEIDKKAREAKEKIVQTGFVAQDVEEAAKSIGYDFSGVDVDEVGIYGLRYAEFVVPLVKAVQELSEQNEQLKAQIEELTKRVDSLQGK
jgi:hypothetical protein